jgi:glycosyltransferase involved in cell wall biosynthesis
MSNNSRREFISVVSPTFNEEGNVRELYSRVTEALKDENINYEFIVIDNASTDKTVEILKELASNDARLKIIVNETNFGHIRSPYHAILQTAGDAVIFLASDLQDPPELIPEYLAEWRKGSKVVFGVKSSSDESWVMRKVRTGYYKLISKISATSVIRNATGAGIYDASVIRTLRTLKEPVPYFRGLLPELGFRIDTLEFHQPKRVAGETKNNFFTLVDMAILGFTTQSKAPMRLISILGLVIALASLFVSFVYVGLKLMVWQSVDFGITPILFGVFFLGAVQIFLIGVIGEYLASMQTRIRNLPHVIERERINF